MSNYIEKTIRPEEVVVGEAKIRWIEPAIFWITVSALLLFAVPYICLGMNPDVMKVFVLVFIVAVFYIAALAIKISKQILTVSNQRVYACNPLANGFERSGMYDTSLELYLANIESATVSGSRFESIFGSTITLSGTGASKIKVTHIANAYEIREAIMNMVNTANNIRVEEKRKKESQRLEFQSQTNEFQQLTMLKSLLDQGIISQAEFDAKKKSILGL